MKEAKEPEDVLKELTIFVGKNDGEEHWMEYSKVKTYTAGWIGKALSKLRGIQPKAQINCPKLNIKVGVVACESCNESDGCQQYQGHLHG